MIQFNHFLKLIWLISICFPPLVFAQKASPHLPVKFPVPQIEFNPKHYICYRTQEELDIDGDLSETSWQKASWTDYFVDIEGDKKPLPRFRTRAKMLWNDEFFYIAAELEEPHIWAKLTQRDTVIFHDNDFEVFIDPDGDTHQYYEFEMNANNTVWDLLLIKPYRDGGPPVNGWDIHGLKTGVKIFGTLNMPNDKDEKWTVEIAMPWEALKECAYKPTPPGAGDVWRVNFSRVEWEIEIRNGKYFKKIDPNTGKPFPEDNWVWSPQGLINMHYPEMWGFVQFSNATVGLKEEIFILPEEEIIKWQLRQFYYWQKNYRLNDGTFAKDINEFVAPYNLFRPEQKIELKSGMEQFELLVLDKKKDIFWMIDQEGRIRKVKK